MTPCKDLLGLKVGYLHVLQRTDNDAHGNPRWECRCECGTHVIMYGSMLRQALRDGLKPRCAYCRPARPVVRTPRKRKSSPGRPQSPSSKFCGYCYGLGHARPRKGVCLGCGKPYEDEQNVHAELRQVSSAALDCSYC